MAIPDRTPSSQELAELLAAKRPQLLAYVERRLGTVLRRKVEPADILQEVAVAALHAWPSGGPQGRDPFGWLCQLAEQRIVDAHRFHVAARKRSAEREVSGNVRANPEASRELIELLAVTMSTPSMKAIRGERQKALEAAIAQLAPEARDAVRWRYGEGLPTKEIAERMGKTDGAVRVLLTRTLQKLQQMLGADESR
jgi:RNA polymerase sigma-70 factor (ECF subfamily)